MAGKRARHKRLFATTWVHVFEEDTADGAVYRPEEDDIPLSRRPRERMQLDPAGSARMFVPGADDRYLEEPATWSEEDGTMVIHGRAGGPRLRIVEQSPTRLLVQAQTTGSS